MTMHGACLTHCVEQSPSNARTDVTDGRTDGDPTHPGEIEDRFVTRAIKAGFDVGAEERSEVAQALDEIRGAGNLERYPVHNRQEREPIVGAKRAIVYARDGHRCLYCQSGWDLTIDHVVPRSSFPAHEIHLADRSDNLVTACWPCNEAKSNRRLKWTPRRPGVTYECFECAYRWEIDAGVDVEVPELTVAAYCGRHGTTTYVPDEGWLM